MSGIIQPEDTRMDADRVSLSVPENTYFSPHRIEVPFLSGGGFETTRGKQEYVVQSSGMNPRRAVLTLSERLTPLLISAGLVNGTTLTFGLRLCNLGIPAGVSFAPDGSVVGIPRQVCIFSREPNHAMHADPNHAERNPGVIREPVGGVVRAADGSC